MFVIHGGRADQPALRHLMEWVRAKGHHVDPRVTWEPGDGVRFASEGARLEMDAVVAIGGDGTVNEVVNGLAGGGTALGIVPLGTANDFARQAGIPDDPDHAMDVILQRDPVLVDLGEMNGRRFLNVSSGGVGAEATADTPTQAKAALGPLAYAITGVRKIGDLAPCRATISAPGFEMAGEFLLFAVGNARATGGGTTVTPRARMTDGLLDVCLVEAMPLASFGKLMLKLRKGQHLGEDGVHYRQLPALRLHSDMDVAVNLDGEPLSAKLLEYQVLPRALMIHVAHLPEDASAEENSRL